MSPGVAAFLRKTNRLNWRFDFTPRRVADVPHVARAPLLARRRRSAARSCSPPLWFAYRWYLVVRPRRATRARSTRARRSSARSPSCATRTRHGDETLQRKAFERVAGELGVERADELTLIARELAWSQRTPEDEEVEEFAEQARGAQEEPSVRIPTLHRDVAVPLADLPRLHGAAQRTSLVRLAARRRARGDARVALRRRAVGGRRPGRGVPRRREHRRRRARHVGEHLRPDLRARRDDAARHRQREPVGRPRSCSPTRAYELLPPNSPPGAMLQFIPFFMPLRYYGSTPVFGQTPWDTFMGGTRVGDGPRDGAAGAEARAREARRDPARQRSRRLERRPGRCSSRRRCSSATDHIPVRIVPLFAAPRDRRLFAALFGDKRVRRPERLHAHREAARGSRSPRRSRGCCCSLGGLLVVLLAGNERLNGRLDGADVAA